LKDFCHLFLYIIELAYNLLKLPAEDQTMRNARGFTILELMIVLAVLAIMAGIAIPNYIGWLPKRHLRSSAIDVQAVIQLAKMTAIRENTSVSLKFNPGSEDYQAFIDANADGNPDGTIFRSKEMSPGIDLTGTGFASDTITFNSRGLANNAGAINLSNRLGQSLTVNVALSGITRIL
jgi:prepilin-type N-terminal cleavage/methylation domain-containing protein